MRTGIILLTTFLAVFLCAGLVSATPYEFTDRVDYFGGYDIGVISEGAPLYYTHNLTDDVNFAAGDQVLEATLTLDFDYDYYDGAIYIPTGLFRGYWSDQTEHLYYAFDGSGWSYFDEVDAVDFEFYDIAVDVSFLNDNGMLNVALAVTNFDRGGTAAYLDWSELSGTAAPVPEPGTIVLMGLGLVGLAGMGRKKLFKK